MRGAMLFCPGVIFYSSKQSLKLYESPIGKQQKHEQNLKRITRQSLVDVGLSIARPADLFNYCIHCELHCYNTADADDLPMQQTRPSSAIVLSHFITRNILISTQEIFIFVRKWLVKRLCLLFAGDDPIHTISMTGLSNQPKYTKGAKTSNDYWGVI